MEIDRVEKNGVVEMWGYEWDLTQHPARKVNLRFLQNEKPVLSIAQQVVVEQEAICWSYGRTLGNIAVSDQHLLGTFPGVEGEDATLCCDIAEAGLMRNGKPRWWCRTHQTHWGTKADIADANLHGVVRCSSHSQPMSYVINPMTIDVAACAEVGIWCSMPPALTNMKASSPRRPKIHVHIRDQPGGEKVFDADVKALSLRYNANDNLFANIEITKVHLTPPSALEFVLALEQGRALGCISCGACGFPHLDLGEFARTEHRKHLCGNCGRDSTWSSTSIVSTPLKPLHDQFSRANQYVDVDRTINLDEYQDYRFQVWASTPAVLWTANRPQERGIHVHIYDGDSYLIDDTYGTVVYQGRRLMRDDLLNDMISNTLA